MSGNRIETKDHLDLPWVVHRLAPDYEIEDVWRMPVGLRPEDNLADFWDQMQLAIAEMSPRTIAAIAVPDSIRAWPGVWLGSTPKYTLADGATQALRRRNWRRCRTRQGW